MVRLRAALLTAVTLSALTAGTVFAAPPVIDTTPLQNGSLGAEYTAFLTANGGEGGPLEFRVVDGKLPSGLKLQRSFGVQSALIFGTPTREGTFTFTVRVEDQAGNADAATFSITIDPPLPLLINNPSPTLRAGTVGEPYAANLFAIGGIQPYRWAIVAGALPDGLGFKGSVISGTPATARTFTFTARVTDKAGVTAEREFTIIVS
jgi:hypothetical protein